jgi:HPt (histidine-containing phosphotransfer) domain-containing protein
VEGDLEVINGKLDKKEWIAPAEMTNLFEGIRSLDDMISSQARRAAAPVRSSKREGSDADTFLAQALTELGETTDWLGSLSSNPEAGQKMLQILHTLKGNAQMHKLTAFAEAVHMVESDLDSLFVKLDKKVEPTPHEIAHIKRVLESLLEHCKTQPFKTSRSGLRSVKKDESQLFLDSVDESISECLAICASNVVQIEDYREMFRTLHTLKSNAELHNLHFIVSSLRDAETNLTTLTEQLEKTSDSRLISLAEVRQGLEKVKQALHSNKKRPA